jgi:O-acetyl-ADP-ribose deacetylase (regulator of RNase III)
LPLTIVHGDLFASPAQTLVNAVNCRGVMGKGLALEFARRYPRMLAEYQRLCASHTLRPGKLHLYSDGAPWILNFPTKDHWRSPSALSYVAEGLEYFVAHYAAWGVESIAFPQLGTGNGGLDWAAVEPIMRRYLAPLPIPVELFVRDFAGT